MVYYTFIFTLVEDFTKMVTKATMSYPTPLAPCAPQWTPNTQTPKVLSPSLSQPVYIGE